MAKHETRGTEERFCIRELFARRGRSLAFSLFIGTAVTEQDVLRIYYGYAVDESVWTVVKSILKERMTHD